MYLIFLNILHILQRMPITNTLSGGDIESLIGSYI